MISVINTHWLLGKPNYQKCGGYQRTTSDKVTNSKYNILSKDSVCTINTIVFVWPVPLMCMQCEMGLTDPFY